MDIDPAGHDLSRSHSQSTIPSLFKGGKRPRPFNDEFYDEGELEYKKAWQRLNHQNVYIPAVEVHVPSNDSQPVVPSKTFQPVVCRLAPCHGELSFSSTSAYEQHYDVTHRYLCYTCGKPMPGERWLQLHIHEMHDILVKIRRERGERTYQCFVAHCQHAFKSTHGRRLHLIDRHKYSQSFNFDIVKEGALSFEKRIKKLGIKRAYRSTTSSLRRDSVTSNGSMDLEHVSSSSSRETSPLPDSHSADTTQRRRASSPSLGSIHQQQQQQKKPQLSHDDHKGTSAKASDGMDMEIDQLQATLSRLTLPKTKAKNHGHTDRPRLQPGFYRGPPIGQHHHLEHSAQQAKPAPDSTAGPVPIATSRVNTWMVPRQVKATATKPLPSKPTRAPVLQDVHME